MLDYYLRLHADLDVLVLHYRVFCLLYWWLDLPRFESIVFYSRLVRSVGCPSSGRQSIYEMINRIANWSNLCQKIPKHKLLADWLKTRHRFFFLFLFVLVLLILLISLLILVFIVFPILILILIFVLILIITITILIFFIFFLFFLFFLFDFLFLVRHWLMFRK